MRAELRAKHNATQSSGQIFLGLMQQLSSPKTFITIFSKELELLKSNIKDQLKLENKLKGRSLITELVKEFSSDVEITFAKTCAEYYSEKDNLDACEIINTNTGLDYRPLFTAGHEHPDDHSERILLNYLKIRKI